MIITVFAENELNAQTVVYTIGCAVKVWANWYLTFTGIQGCLSIKGRPPANVIHRHAFWSCDLDPV